ncbi:MAG: tyrosine-type recombinase/integrase [Nitrospira sp.]
METVTTYRRKLDHFLHWWATSQPDLFWSLKLAQQYALRLETDLRSSRTRSLHLSVMRQWGRFLRAHGRVSASPWDRIVGPRLPVWLATDWLKLHEVKRLLRSFDRTHLSQLRDAVIVRIMLKTGAREAELAQAKIRDLHPSGAEGWLFLHSKGKRQDEPVLLLSNVKEELEAYLLRRFPNGRFPPDAPLFTTVHNNEERPIPTREMRRRITAALQRVGVRRPGITPLSLRLTAGKQALAKQAPLRAVKEMMRHEDIKTTKRLADQEHRKSTAAERFLTHY